MVDTGASLAGLPITAAKKPPMSAATSAAAHPRSDSVFSTPPTSASAIPLTTSFSCSIRHDVQTVEATPGKTRGRLTWEPSPCALEGRCCKPRPSAFHGAILTVHAAQQLVVRTGLMHDSRIAVCESLF